MPREAHCPQSVNPLIKTFVQWFPLWLRINITDLTRAPRQAAVRGHREDTAVPGATNDLVQRLGCDGRFQIRGERMPARCLAGRRPEVAGTLHNLKHMKNHLCDLRTRECVWEMQKMELNITERDGLRATTYMGGLKEKQKNHDGGNCVLIALKKKGGKEKRKKRKEEKRGKRRKKVKKEEKKRKKHWRKLRLNCTQSVRYLFLVFPPFI